ncbi:hypothetical protein ACFL7D_10785, partial [candidate division KSB1 bacterium]
GGGLKFLRKLNDSDNSFGYGFIIGNIRGSKEAVVYDPYYYDPYFPYKKVGNEYFTLVVPISVSLKKRLFKNAIESDMRPYIVGEAGPVYGIAFPNTGKFTRSFSKGKGQVTLGAFVGFGVDFGEEAGRTYGITIGFHYMRFLEPLGERRDYPGFDIRLSFIR